MSKKKKILIIILVLLVITALGVGGFFAYKIYFSKEDTKDQTIEVKSQALKLEPKKEATYLSKVADTNGVYFMRGFDIVWNDIEPEKGKFDWEMTDERMKEDMGGEVYFLAIVWPYANWDQKACHTEEKYKATGHLKRGGEDLYMGKPCDMEAYASFLEKVVERYDGDGVDDMPGLTTPIKYWEILNEPSMQGGSLGGAGEDLKFFVGTSLEYFDILKTSYEAIKKADPEAKVAHAGMAGMMDNFVEFWTPIFDLGAGDYFDIANIHTISTDEKREDLFMIKFKRFLKKYGLEDKPIWITEVQFGDLMDKPVDLESFNKLIAKASVFALAQGADKLFYIETWVFWDNKEFLEPPKDEKDDKKMKQSKPKLDLTNNTTHKVYLNLIDKVNNFDKVETIKEEYTEGNMDHDGATSKVGQYKFINGNNVVYVLWGQAALPSEISGKVTVTDIYGESSEIDASSLSLSDTPIFVELTGNYFIITFQQKYGNDWNIKWDSKRNTPSKVSGFKVDLGMGEITSAEKAKEVAEGFIIDNEDFLKVRFADLELGNLDHINKKWLFSYFQRYKGVPVYSAKYRSSLLRLVLTEEGELLGLRADLFPDIEVSSTEPKISKEQIVKKVKGLIPLKSAEINIELVILSEDTEDSFNYRLVWKTVAHSADPVFATEYFLDANNGEMLKENDLIVTGSDTENDIENKTVYSDKILLFAFLGFGFITLIIILLFFLKKQHRPRK